MPISSGIGPASVLNAQFSPVTPDPEQVTPDIEQHAVGSVDNTLVNCPIICHIRTTQQQSGDDESQLATCASVNEIHDRRANDKNAFLNVYEIICCLKQ